MGEDQEAETRRGEIAISEYAIERARFRRTWDEIPRREHPLFGSLLAPERPEQLLTVLRQLRVLRIGAWRGQANAAWKIDSALARRYQSRAWLGPTFRVTEANVRAVERELAERARSVGLAEDLSELELMARLQHHGAATRLLDCTRNAFVAVWFACREGKHAAEDGLLIGLRLHEHARFLRTNMLRLSIDELLASDHDRPLWWAPRNLSPRISAQQAIFVLGRIVSEPWGSIALGHGEVEEEGLGTVPGAALLLISPQLKEALHGDWEDLFGFSKETLFPDFDGFAQAHAVDEDFAAFFPLGAADAVAEWTGED